MPAPDPAIPHASPADPALRDALMTLVQCGVRIAQVAADLAETERRAVATMATGLPATVDATSAHEAKMAGLAVDALDLALLQASPRIVAASQSYERAARAVRRTVALIQRLDTGWRPRGGSDGRAAMARRHVAKSVGQRIARHAEGEAAERLFDDLNEHLHLLEQDGAFDRPAEALIAAICRDLGLPGEEPAGPEAATPRAPAAPAPASAAPDG